MTFDQFNEYQAKLLEEVVGMKDTKGKEYAHSKDRFANFNRLAEELGLSNLVVAWVYTKKHLDAICNYVCETRYGKEPTKLSEPIRGRIVDAITYLTLIGGMIEERKNNRKEALSGWAVGVPQTFVAPNITCYSCGHILQVGVSEEEHLEKVHKLVLGGKYICTPCQNKTHADCLDRKECDCLCNDVPF